MIDIIFLFIILGLIVAIAAAIRFALKYLSYDVRARGETEQNDGNESVANARRAEVPEDLQD